MLGARCRSCANQWAKGGISAAGISSAKVLVVGWCAGNPPRFRGLPQRVGHHGRQKQLHLALRTLRQPIYADWSEPASATYGNTRTAVSDVPKSLKFT